MKLAKGLHPNTGRCPECNCILDRHDPRSKRNYTANCLVCNLSFDIQGNPDHMDTVNDSKLLLHYQCPNEGIMYKYPVKQMDFNVTQFAHGVRVEVRINCPACGKIHIHQVK